MKKSLVCLYVEVRYSFRHGKNRVRAYDSNGHRVSQGGPANWATLWDSRKEDQVLFEARVKEDLRKVFPENVVRVYFRHIPGGTAW